MFLRPQQHSDRTPTRVTDQNESMAAGLIVSAGARASVPQCDVMIGKHPSVCSSGAVFRAEASFPVSGGETICSMYNFNHSAGPRLIPGFAAAPGLAAGPSLAAKTASRRSNYESPMMKTSSKASSLYQNGLEHYQNGLEHYQSVDWGITGSRLTESPLARSLRPAPRSVAIDQTRGTPQQYYIRQGADSPSRQTEGPSPDKEAPVLLGYSSRRKTRQQPVSRCENALASYASDAALVRRPSLTSGWNRHVCHTPANDFNGDFERAASSEEILSPEESSNQEYYVNNRGTDSSAASCFPPEIKVRRMLRSTGSFREEMSAGGPLVNDSAHTVYGSPLEDPGNLSVLDPGAESPDLLQQMASRADRRADRNAPLYGMDRNGMFEEHSTPFGGETVYSHGHYGNEDSRSLSQLIRTPQRDSSPEFPPVYQGEVRGHHKLKFVSHALLQRLSGHKNDAEKDHPHAPPDTGQSSGYSSQRTTSSSGPNKSQTDDSDGVVTSSQASDSVQSCEQIATSRRNGPQSPSQTDQSYEPVPHGAPVQLPARRPSQRRHGKTVAPLSKGYKTASNLNSIVKSTNETTLSSHDSGKGELEPQLSFESSPQPPSLPKTTSESRQRSLFLAATHLSQRIPYAEIREATGNFDSSRQLGRGGCGAVFYGILRRSATEIAVKALNDKGPNNGFSEELLVLSRCRHKNLVALLGWAKHEDRRFLIYEFVEGGDLCHRLQQHAAAVKAQRTRGRVRSTNSVLYSGGRNGLFEWRERLRVALETSQAVAYLHSSSPAVFHRDLKAANILLDRFGSVKLGDFGLACLADNMKAAAKRVNKAEGTPGYADPRYVSTLQITAPREVYSLGMLYLELLTSRPPAVYAFSGEQRSLRYLLDELDASDPSAIQNAIDSTIHCPAHIAEPWVSLALRCISDDEGSRPTAADAAHELRRLMHRAVGGKDFAGRRPRFAEVMMEERVSRPEPKPFPLDHSASSPVWFQRKVVDRKPENRSNASKGTPSSIMAPVVGTHRRVNSLTRTGPESGANAASKSAHFERVTMAKRSGKSSDAKSPACRGALTSRSRPSDSVVEELPRQPGTKDEPHRTDAHRYEITWGINADGTATTTATTAASHRPGRSTSVTQATKRAKAFVTGISPKVESQRTPGMMPTEPESLLYDVADGPGKLALPNASGKVALLDRRKKLTNHGSQNTPVPQSKGPHPAASPVENTKRGKRDSSTAIEKLETHDNSEAHSFAVRVSPSNILNVPSPAPGVLRSKSLNGNRCEIPPNEGPSLFDFLLDGYVVLTPASKVAGATTSDVVFRDAADIMNDLQNGDVPGSIPDGDTVKILIGEVAFGRKHRTFNDALKERLPADWFSCVSRHHFSILVAISLNMAKLSAFLDEQKRRHRVSAKGSWWHVLADKVDLAVDSKIARFSYELHCRSANGAGVNDAPLSSGDRAVVRHGDVIHLFNSLTSSAAGPKTAPYAVGLTFQIPRDPAQLRTTRIALLNAFFEFIIREEQKSGPLDRRNLLEMTSLAGRRDSGQQDFTCVQAAA